jgi:hypothetical protein
MKRSPILTQLDVISATVADAHDHHVNAAMAGVEWERRGLLQRLKRRN